MREATKRIITHAQDVDIPAGGVWLRGVPLALGEEGGVGEVPGEFRVVGDAAAEVALGGEVLGGVGRQSNDATAKIAGTGQAGASLDLAQPIFAISYRRDAVHKHEGDDRQR